MNFSERVFNLSSPSDFDTLCLEIFRFQAAHCAPYKKYIELLGITPQIIDKVEKIPFLPVEFFKTHKIVSAPKEAEVVFTSSGTTGSAQSRHYVTDVSVYETSFRKGFEFFYDAPERCNIYALLPSYLEREGSSLIYMVEGLIKASADGDFFLYNHEELIARLSHRDKTRKTILFGVSFALLELAENHRLDLSENVSVMETGGMKGRRKELPREELHHILKTKLNVECIHSEYGMCEALSQSYSTGDGIFVSPPWMKIITRDPNDPCTTLTEGRRGAINIIDLANYNSCSFLATKDIGCRFSDGTFTVEGRLTASDIRGCNLLIEESKPI